MARQTQAQIVTVGQGLDRATIILWLGIPLILLNVIASSYWRGVFGAVFTPHWTAPDQSTGTN